MSMEVKNSVKPIDYLDSMIILEKRVEDVILGEKGEFLWILEHKHVYTAGTSSNDKDVINKSIKIIKTKRGGKHTYHGPGQKVIYFVLNLNKRKKDIRKLISMIERCIISVLKKYGVESFADRKNIGIWVTRNGKIRKIAAIGIRVKRWIAYHGFSININNNLTQYLKIVPCGLDNQKITSVYNENGVMIKNIEKKIIDIFIKNINKI